ncbi:hypothetical protein BDF19DRAFT_434832 [Syncephalis fuscata]|nr:hypothetical protein BDF19DRAFT_434832 [Syncephalis fuscata]
MAVSEATSIVDTVVVDAIVEDTTVTDITLADTTATLVALSKATEGPVDIAVLTQRLRQLERRLLARDPRTGLAPWADEAPEPTNVLVNSGLLPNSTDNEMPSEQTSNQEDMDAEPTEETSPVDPATKSLMDRLTAVREAIESQLSHRQVIKDLWDHYETCRPLIIHSINAKTGTTGTTGVPIEDTEDKADDKLQFERAVLSIDARAHLLAETADEWIRTVSLLEEASEKQANINSVEFQQVSKFTPRLKTVSATNTVLIEQSKKLDAKLGQLLTEYNDTIHTLSQLFLHWNQMLDDLDARVSLAERRGRI